MMNYTLILPDPYTKPLLPGRDEWVADLRANPDKQGEGYLHKGDQYCCLGRLSLIQGRLTSGLDLDGCSAVLSTTNPVYNVLDRTGCFPKGVCVMFEEESRIQLSACNDAGLTFAQIADIIEAVWDNAPRNW